MTFEVLRRASKKKVRSWFVKPEEVDKFRKSLLYCALSEESEARDAGIGLLQEYALRPKGMSSFEKFEKIRYQPSL